MNDTNIAVETVVPSIFTDIWVSPRGGIFVWGEDATDARRRGKVPANFKAKRMVTRCINYDKTLYRYVFRGSEESE